MISGRRPAPAASVFSLARTSVLFPDLLTPEQARRRLSEAPERTLAVVEYGVQELLAPPVLHVRVPLRTHGSGPAVELWAAGGRVTRDRRQGVEVSHDGALLFASMELRGVAGSAGFEQRIESAYSALTQTCGALGYPYPLRIWNFIPGIHEMHAGLDRYQAFCRARHEPLARHLRIQGGGFPAATVVGTRGSGGVLYLLAAREPGRHLENPRQLPPPDYPERYGPRSPSFSRATLARAGAETALYISGTASIVGHETRHPYETVSQCDEVLRNLDELLKTAGRAGEPVFRDLRDLVLARVFLRDLGEVPAVSETLNTALSGRAVILYHEGDLCRRELMIEIEGIAAPAAETGMRSPGQWSRATMIEE
jgi:chorismate lyase/3-hydroxybenzoate synthase